jgi:hypothetical protein
MRQVMVEKSFNDLHSMLQVKVGVYISRGVVYVG